MDFFNRLKQSIPTPEGLIEAAATDYRESTKLLTEVSAKLAEARAAVPALSECMAVMRKAVDAARKDLEEVADERLKYFLDPAFDEKWLGELDMTFSARSGALSNTTFVLFADAWLDLAEQRLKRMGADKSKLTFAAKRKRIAELEADAAAVAKVQEHSLNSWRKLTSNRVGYPS